MTPVQALYYHARAYPEMRPADAVKLLYQNEFGGGHLIEDPRRSLEWLKAELAAVRHDPSAAAYAPLGSGVVRANLAALDTGVMSIERLNEVFVSSAQAIRGSMDSFKRKLGALERLTENGVFGFSPKQLAEYLSDYEKRGCPPVTHSPEYRLAYAPAYRVVLERLLK